jgi:thymidine phosphorylase
MDLDETVQLTKAMAHSGQRLSWAGTGLAGPLLDKHSTGGVGDKVSLLLAPLVAACGGVVPMVSGRGLGHTGGTLDKLEALPGYGVAPSPARLLQALRDAGCAIVGASAGLAPADQRLYAIRDVTATVESLPLIIASILGKKLAAGVQALVLDVKVGSGSFTPQRSQALALARGLVEVARAAGLPARALVTDMNQVLGHSAGNALEVQEALEFLRGGARDPRLHAVTMALAVEMLQLGGLADSTQAARARAEQALASGAAAECFGRMVAALGGPRDVLAHRTWPAAPVQRAVAAVRDGILAAVDVRALGMAVVGLGGGRGHPDDRIDSRVGLARLLPLGSRVRAGDTLALVHAASEAQALQAVAVVGAAMRIDEADAAGSAETPLVEHLAETG